MFWHLFVSEGVGDLLFFVASVLPVGWGISKVLTFVDERGLRRVSRIHVLSIVIMTPYASVDSLI